MNNRTRIGALSLCIRPGAGKNRSRRAGPAQADQLKKLAAEGYETDPAVLKAIATGGTPMGRWKEGLTFDGVAPMPWLKSAANWFPKTEEVQPDEIRVTFMGSSPLPRPGQMGTSVYVELGNGDNFIFDMGPGSIANYLAAGVPLNRLNDIFLTHLHWDHVATVPYVYMFGAWAGRWHETFRITGPSGTKPEYGVRYMMDRMKEMLTWHRDSFDESPIGKGFDMEVNEFDFRDDGGVAYEKNGVKITHWRQSHTEDGASAYRLDWNGMCVAFTGDGRPNSLTIKYAEGCDLLITEVQAELMAISATVNGVLPVIGRNTIDIGPQPRLRGRIPVQQGEAAHGHDHAHELRRLLQPGAACRDPLPLQGAIPFWRARHGGGEPDARQGLGPRWRGAGLPEPWRRRSSTSPRWAGWSFRLRATSVRTSRSSRSATPRFRRTSTTRRATSRN